MSRDVPKPPAWGAFQDACVAAGHAPRIRRALGYAYVMNKLDFYLENDPREKALRDAVYRAMARLADRPAGREDDAGSRQIAAVSTAA